MTVYKTLSGKTTGIYLGHVNPLTKQQIKSITKELPVKIITLSEYTVRLDYYTEAKNVNIRNKH